MVLSQFMMYVNDITGTTARMDILLEKAAPFLALIASHILLINGRNSANSSNCN